MNKIIVFRVDSSCQIATGHVMRCLTLAKYLKKYQIEIVFICRDLEGNVIERIEKEGFNLRILTKPNVKLSVSENEYDNWFEVTWYQDASETEEILSELKEDITLIIDHYSIDYKWHKSIRPFVKKIVVIDDLANRKHDCDIVIDQNLYHDFQNRYNDLVSDNCQKFLGNDYAILREQFYQISKRDRNNVRNILIFFGGIDPDNLTLKAINSVILAQQSLNVGFNVIVIGAKNNFQAEVMQLCTESTFEYKLFVDNMAEIMNWADLSIGAGGTTSWERCHLNLPAIVISFADNQIEICNALADYGMIKYLGNSKDITEEIIMHNLIDVYNDFDFEMISSSSKLNELIEAII
ncbi:MAG: UDP-2,4-diacetamido-2,4,6-trideoxy-beta-L-altropyranose hydrolase [Rickettsiales bacterium]|jgi:UDP-2,4-diacetamido-2,4,6-trideoxy-beta-L-altropyranose hydrolase|nr:UDP-2,4-diacetamido-2,4,6-trideoxy-beta-L-altropyranose hydrolase [Rickettsiales bacterium]